MSGNKAQSMSSAPTLADVAQLANVSTATVSRCLNSPDLVVEKTRARVLAAVAELGYLPNFGARVLAAKHTNTIGAIIPTMENAIFARGIQAFQEELRERGVTLLVASSQYRVDLEEEQIRTLVARGADALLLIGYDRNEEIYRFLESRGIPVLIAWAHDPFAQPPSIGFDNKNAMTELAEEVISMGHRRIGYISAHLEGNDRARDRLAAVRATMERHGHDPDTLKLIETSYSIENGGIAFQEISGLPAPPTVVMCGNDVLAVGALLAAKKMGLRIPEDVSITGFDDIELASVAEPPLTTVHVPHRKMGREAARALVNMVNNVDEQTRIMLETHLCLRGTLASVGG